MEKTCRNCIHWENNQRLLNYWDSLGFCVNPDFSFGGRRTDGRMVGVIDLKNEKPRNQITGNPAHDFESIDRLTNETAISRYLLQTDENFGCVFFEQNQLDEQEKNKLG